MRKSARALANRDAEHIRERAEAKSPAPKRGRQGIKENRKGEMRRKAMLTAARRLIVENGIETLSHNTVASALGMSKSAVIWHFPTKRALWEALIVEYVEHLEAELDRHCAPFVRAGLAPDRAILPAMRSWFGSFSANREGWIEVGAALIGLARHDAALIEPIRAWYRELYARLSSSGLERTAAFAAMMAFDGFFNASKMGILVLSREDADSVQKAVLRTVFGDLPVGVPETNSDKVSIASSEAQ